MVVSGKVRGNASQLARYLVTPGDNERITILDVDGRAFAGESYLKDTLYSMELNSELSRSRNSVYHAFINPNPDEKEDRAMSFEDWQQSADILAKNLSLEQQRRVIVLHEKKGRIHAHVVFERYNHERGIMVDYKNNYVAHDKAREEMEIVFNHKRTPKKNRLQSEHKKILTALWADTNSGEQFVKRAKEKGYLIATGTDRPFRVVDSYGRSFDLVRQLDKIKTSDVSARLKTIKLLDDKRAIEQMVLIRNQKENASALVSKTQSPIKSLKMNWNSIINENKLSPQEILAKSEGKLELLKEMKQKAEQDLSAKYKKQMLNQLLQQKVKVEEALEKDMDDKLDHLYRAEQAETAFGENKNDSLKMGQAKQSICPVVLENKDDLVKSQRDTDNEKLQKFLQEMEEARLRNLALQNERQPN